MARPGTQRRARCEHHRRRANRGQTPGAGSRHAPRLCAHDAGELGACRAVGCVGRVVSGPPIRRRQLRRLVRPLCNSDVRRRPALDRAAAGQPVEAARLALSIAALAAGSLATLSRWQRAAMLEVVRQDFVRTAHAKGLSALRVAVVHALRNALLPMVTLAGMHLPRFSAGPSSSKRSSVCREWVSRRFERSSRTTRGGSWPCSWPRQSSSRSGSSQATLFAARSTPACATSWRAGKGHAHHERRRFARGSPSTFRGVSGAGDATPGTRPTGTCCVIPSSKPDKSPLPT